MNPRTPAWLVLAVLLCPVPALAQLSEEQIRSRLPTYVNTAETSPDLRADWVRAPETAFPLRAPAGPFSVTYAFDGQTRTLEDYLAQGNITAFLVLKGDRIVFEDYLHGTGREDRYLSYSVSKSIVSTLVGIAVDEGDIESVTDPVTRYLPFLRRSAFGGATVQDVLRMATNVDFSEEYGAADSDIAILHGAVRGRGELPFAEYALTLPSAGEPGTEFRYQSINTQILAMILEAATGIRLDRYAERKLWDGIGAESDAYFLTGREQPGICAYGCFYATPRDYGRFGLMSLRGGEMGGNRVVSEAWMREATTPAPFAQPEMSGDGCRTGYGYQWWIPCGPPGAFQARGVGGQTIFIHPESDVVIAKFSVASSPEDLVVFDAIIEALAGEP